MAVGNTALMADRSRCARCSTELPPHALACPACGALVHAEQLKQLAAVAESAASGGELVRAREAWELPLRLLPPDSKQYALIQGRVGDLATRIERAPSGAGSPAAKRAGDAPWWRRGAAAIVSVAVLLIGKLKFLLLGLTKASTFLSMFAFFGVYWSLYGWPLALGIV